MILKEKFDVFRDSFIEVTQELADIEFSTCESVENFPEITVVIGITGSKNGRILIQTDKATADKFAIAMNCGDPLDGPEDLFMYLAEFGNIYCGRITTVINNLFKNREITLTPPSVYSDECMSIFTMGVDSDIFHFKSEIGAFTIDLGFEES